MTILTETDYYHRFVNIFNECGWKIYFDHYNSNDTLNVINIEFEKLEQCRKEFCKNLNEEDMRIFREYWCLGSNEELLKNFETYMRQVLSTIYENNWYINPNRFSNPIELFNYIIHIHNYGFSLDNHEIDEENQHNYEESSESESSESESSDSESSDSESSESENIREARRVSLEQYYGSNS